MADESLAQIFHSGSWEIQEQFTDGALQTDDGTTFRIHRIILSQRSAYFRALLGFNKHQETIVIPNIDSKFLEIILMYIYTGDVILDEKNVWDMIMLSDYMCLDDLLKICQSFALQNMTCTNCLPSLAIAWQIESLEAIRKDYYRYALVHFEDILKTANSGLEDIPFKILKQLLQSESLNVISERSVWTAIVTWTEFDSSSRLSHVLELLSYLRLEEDVDEELSEEILSHTIITDNSHCYGLMLAKEFNNLMKKQAILSQYARSVAKFCQWTLPPPGPRSANHLYIIARHVLTPTKRGSELFLSYDGELDFWRPIGEADFFIDTMVQIGSDDGSDGQFICMFNETSEFNLIFDTKEEVWSPISISPARRHNSFMIALNKQLYSVGGSRSNRDTTEKIYRYKFDEDLWEFIVMPSRVFVCGAFILRGLIFIVGITDEQTLICPAYDPEEDSWSLFPSPSIYRWEFSVAVLHEKAFVVGGENDEHYLRSVEMYDPFQNCWMPLPDLPNQYFSPKAVVVDGKIIVYENNNDSALYNKVNPPVSWDQNAWLWRNIDTSSPLLYIQRYSFYLLDDHHIVKEVTAKSRSRPGIEWERILSA